MTWLKDANGNKCSVEYWGSQEAAQRALDSLKDCHNCINCSDCSECYRCSVCSGCSGCSRCYRCSRCSDLKKARPVEADGAAGNFAPPATPVIPDLHKKIYEAASRPEALAMDSFHTCETTHCRAGWVVHLAGEQGKGLEQFFNTELAAMMIYKASGYNINPSRFYDSDNDALADMKRLAEAS